MESTIGRAASCTPLPLKLSGSQFRGLNNDRHKTLNLICPRPGDLEVQQHRPAVAKFRFADEPAGQVGRIKPGAFDGAAEFLLADCQLAAGVNERGQLQLAVLNAPGDRAFRDGEGFPFRRGVVGEVAEDGADGDKVARRPEAATCLS